MLRLPLGGEKKETIDLTVKSKSANRSDQLQLPFTKASRSIVPPVPAGLNSMPLTARKNAEAMAILKNQAMVRSERVP